LTTNYYIVVVTLTKADKHNALDMAMFYTFIGTHQTKVTDRVFVGRASARQI